MLRFEPPLVWRQRYLALVLCAVKYIKCCRWCPHGYLSSRYIHTLEVMFTSAAPIILGVLWTVPSFSCATFNLLFSPDSRTIENLKENVLQALQGKN